MAGPGPGDTIKTGSGATIRLSSPPTTPQEDYYQDPIHGYVQEGGPSNWFEKNLWWLAPLSLAATAPLGSASAATSGTGAAAGGASAGVPSMPWTIPAGFEASMGAAPPALGSIAPTVATTAASGAGAGSALKNFLTNPANLAKLATIGIPALMQAFGNNGGSNTSGAEQALLDEALRRTQRTDPLHQAVTQLAFSRLPVSARQGINLTGK